LQQKIKELADKANKLPLLPGVYIMLDDKGEVIYVGKAKKLKNRVSSYFHGEHLPKVAAMVEKVDDFNVIVANSEFEALVLENSLIKQHKPHYNILLKDDKGYPFIRLDIKSDYPSFSIVNKPVKDGARYFGPYGGRGTTKSIIETLQKTLMMPTCSKKFPNEIGKSRPCLNYHMHTCSGWCVAGSSQSEYKSNMLQAELILDGKTDRLIEQLQAQMNDAAENLRFEVAANIRDRIRAVNELANKQRVIATTFSDIDAVGFCRGPKSAFVVMHYRDGNLVGKDLEIVSEPVEEDDEAVTDFVQQYYYSRNLFPKTIMLPFEPEDDSLEQWLEKIAGRKVKIEIPQRGEKHKIIETAFLNAKEEVVRITTLEQRKSKTLEKLQQMLGIETFPKRIEAFDISNLGDTGIVAAMTVHVDGKPYKKDYRKFRIKDLDIRDDYASMRQAVGRRLQHYIDGDVKFAPLPDLLLIDGGQTHAQTAKSVADELGVKVPIFGMVKDDRHRTRALIDCDGNEIGINNDQAIFSLIGRIQEETHRFAIEYQRKLRNEALGSCLNEIEGIGEKRKNDLINEFKTIKAIKCAEVDELKKVVPKNTAEAVYDYFHNEKEITE